MSNQVFAMLASRSHINLSYQQRPSSSSTQLLQGHLAGMCLSAGPRAELLQPRVVTAVLATQRECVSQFIAALPIPCSPAGYFQLCNELKQIVAETALAVVRSWIPRIEM